VWLGEAVQYVETSLDVFHFEDSDGNLHFVHFICGELFHRQLAEWNINRS
jgi:hypothetical protein